MLIKAYSWSVLMSYEKEIKRLKSTKLMHFDAAELRVTKIPGF